MKETSKAAASSDIQKNEPQESAIERVVNLINPYDEKREFQVFSDGERTLKMSFSHQNDAIDISKIFAADTGEKLLDIEYFEGYKSNKQIVLLPCSPLSKSHVLTDLVKTREINHEAIVQTFWARHTTQKFERTEALIVISIFLAQHADKNSMGLSVSLGELATHLGMSIRRVSNNIQLLEEKKYICLHTKVTKKGHTGLQSYIELTEKFWLNFTSVFADVNEYHKHLHHTLVSNDSPYIVKNSIDHFQFRTNLHHLKQELIKFVRRKDCPTNVRTAVFRVLG
ncbi:helix-turn-helix domain-containing protein [Vibrio splendidus]